MKRKRILVLGVVLVLLALAAGAVFADGNYKGVVWGKSWENGGIVTHVWNHNDYDVTAGIKNVDTDEYRRLKLAPNATRTIEGEWIVTAVHSF